MDEAFQMGVAVGRTVERKTVTTSEVRPAIAKVSKEAMKAVEVVGVETMELAEVMVKGFADLKKSPVGVFGRE